MLGFTAGGSLIFYTFTTYMQKYLVNTAGMSAKTASAVMTFALLAYMLMQPLFGMLSDRIGRKTSMLWFGTLGTLCTLPILLALKTVSSPYMAFFLIILALAIVSLYTSISGLIKAEMFLPEVRARRRSVLRGGQRDLRRLGRVRRPGAEVGRDGERLLLVCFSHVPAGAAGLREPAGPAQGQLPERRALTGREKENR